MLFMQGNALVRVYTASKDLAVRFNDVISLMKPEEESLTAIPVDV